MPAGGNVIVIQLPKMEWMLQPNSELHFTVTQLHVFHFARIARTASVFPTFETPKKIPIRQSRAYFDQFRPQTSHGRPITERRVPSSIIKDVLQAQDLVLPQLCSPMTSEHYGSKRRYY